MSKILSWFWKKQKKSVPQCQTYKVYGNKKNNSYKILKSNIR